MKKFVSFALAALMIFSFSAVSYAENSFTLSSGGNSYTIDEASVKGGGFPFDVSEENGRTVLADPETGLKVTVGYNAIDKDAIQKLREYYNDSASSDDDIFEKYVRLQQSYIPTMLDYYRTAFLGGEDSKPDTESNMKLFYSGSEKVFGLDSQINLYNTETSDKLEYNETTHLDILTPVPSKHAFISIRAEEDTGSLNKDSVKKFGEILGSLRFEDLPPQTGLPVFLNDGKLISAVYEGIYPEMHRRQAQNSGSADSRDGSRQVYTAFSDREAGFSISVPDTYFPYIQDSLGGKLYFGSYKITPSQSFSITAERTDSNDPKDTLGRRIDLVKSLNKTAAISDEGTKTINGRVFSYIEYNVFENGGFTYFFDYFASEGSSVYKLELKSRFQKPSEMLLDEFDNILSSFVAEAASSPSAATAPADAAIDGMNEFVSRAGGYGFSYPKSWRLDDFSGDINYDDYKLIVPDMPGPLEIAVSQGELNPGLEPQDAAACLSGQDADQYGKYIKKYTPPYKGTNFKVLDVSQEFDGETAYVYKLTEYTGDDGRPRLSYSVDIVRGRRVDSIFVTLGEYMSSNGRLADSITNKLVNYVVSSFKTIDTPDIFFVSIYTSVSYWMSFDAYVSISENSFGFEKCGVMSSSNSQSRYVLHSPGRSAS